MERTSAEEIAAATTLEDFEQLARQRMDAAAYEYVAGGAGAGLTERENRAAFERIRLRPRVLADVSRIDTRVRLFERDYAFPILLAPTGYHKLVHPEGEIETVRGANQSEAALVAACFSTVAFEEMQRAAKEPLWFQLYIQSDRGFTRELVERVIEAGCGAVCVTVDVPVIGPRDRERRAGFRLPAGVARANLASLGAELAAAAHRPVGRNIYSGTHGADATWKDLEWLRELIKKPLLVKGILHPEDAWRAAELGCDGVMVSNHGGRSVDTVEASMDALPAVIDRLAGRVPVLLDGGVRRGIDVFKALACGAAAVLIGRPYLYGLAAGGAAGVARVVDILRTELEMTMGLVGCPGIKDIKPEHVSAAI